MRHLQEKRDCCAYIRGYYHVPAYVGMRVRIRGQEGVIVNATHSTHYVHVRLDGETRACVYHPTDGVEYLVERRLLASEEPPA